MGCITVGMHYSWDALQLGCITVGMHMGCAYSWHDTCKGQVRIVGMVLARPYRLAQILQGTP